MQNKLKMLRYIILTVALLTIISSGAYAQLPFAPALISPAQRDSCVSVNSQFIWQEELYSNIYELQISRNITFTNLVSSITTPNTFTNVSLPNYHYTYFWRVIVRYDSRNNNKIDTSEVRQFKTVFASPTALLPIDNAECLQSKVKIQWVQPDSTNRYKIQISENPNFNIIAKDTIVLGNNTLNWKAPKNFITYYWRVRTEMHTGCASDWSPIYRFSIAEKAPTPVLPSNNAIGREQSVKLVWSYDITKENFIVRYSTNSDFSSAQTTTVSNLADTSFIVTGLALNTEYYWQVSSMINGCQSDWSEAMKFTTKYPVTALLTPANNEGCVSMKPTLKWKAVPTARAYSILVSTTDTFADTVLIMLNNNDTTAVIDLPNGITNYFWKVKAADQKNYGDWSGVSSFTTTYKAPTLIYPAAGALGLDRKITFKWAKPYNDVEYMFELYKVKDSANIKVYSNILRDTVNTDTINVILQEYNQNYVWRVGTIDVNNCNGMWSKFNELRTKLSAPVLLAPENYSKKLSTDLMFKWTLVDSAKYYEIELASDSTFKTSSITNSISYVTLNSINIRDLKYNFKYYWRVRAYDNNSASDWSKFFRFNTKLQPAAQPVLIAPSNNATAVSVLPQFIWGKSAGAKSYRFMLAGTDNFNEQAIMDTVIKDTAIISTVKLKNYADYYWKVGAINDSNDVTWSVVNKFRAIAPELKLAPNLIAPANNSTDLELSLKFEWENVPTAYKYHIQIAKANTFEANNIVVEDSNVTWNIRSLNVKDYGTEYFWRVSAVNEAGKGPWSQVFKFKTYGKTGNIEDNNIVKFNIYPNPVFDNLTVTYFSEIEQAANIIITDATGKTVMSSNALLNTNANDINMNINHLSQGIYFLTIKTANADNKTIKFTVIK